MVNPGFIYKGMPPPAILCICYAAAAGYLASEEHHLWALALSWPAVLYGLVTFAYIYSGRFGALLLNKNTGEAEKKCPKAWRSTGCIPMSRLLVFLPYLLTSWLTWWLRHVFMLSHEDSYNLVAPGVYLGRYPLWLPWRRGDVSAPLPACKVAVVDLCAEFPALPWVVAQAEGRYFCLPCLDGDMPEDKQALLRVAREVASWDTSQPVYVHCANGRGRSLCFAALVLVLRNGGPTTVDDAIASIKRQRPQVNAQRPQRDLVAEVLRMHNMAGDVELSQRLIGLPGRTGSPAAGVLKE
mmetsp:Transcript_84322/g.139576  ORF Transcript_84322/g.139576 Transcript_84322/m.139576 type:complete len:297 (-) Transcript_84322:43-933(-)